MDKLNEILKQIAQTTETATVGYTNGAFLGNFDEFMGGATVATTLNQNNYLMGRDAVRQLSNNLYQQNPYLYAIAETLGAATTPLQLFKSSKYAPLGRQDKNRLYNAVTDTAVATIGYSDLSDPKDVAENAAKLGVGNFAGNYVANQMLGRGVGNVARTGYDVLGNLLSTYFADALNK